MCDRPRRILVIDEDAPSRAVTCIALELKGHACLHVATQETAAVIERFRPNVIIYECHRRDSTGRGLSRRLRDAAEKLSADVVLIALSTLGEPPSFRTAESIDAYLVKPFQIDELDAAIRGGVVRSGSPSTDDSIVALTTRPPLFVVLPITGDLGGSGPPRDRW